MRGYRIIYPPNLHDGEKHHHVQHTYLKEALKLERVFVLCTYSSQKKLNHTITSPPTNSPLLQYPH